MIAAFLAITEHLPIGRVATSHNGTTSPTHGKALSAEPAVAPRRDLTRSDFASNALSDMRVCAARRLGLFEEIPESFDGTSQWSPEWHLQWLDVEHDGKVFRIYHATDVRHPQNRFTAIWQNDHADWEHAY